jgi:hypothetical protein
MAAVATLVVAAAVVLYGYKYCSWRYAVVNFEGLNEMTTTLHQKC